MHKDRDMEYRCPKCHRFGMFTWLNGLQCMWKDCSYKCSYKYEDNFIHDIKFDKFKEHIIIREDIL